MEIIDKSIDIDEIKKIELGILKEFDNYCRNNNLRYSLGEGTLIGAVRHKGFIPWDDDVDVLMPREDFDKFIADYKSSEYSVVSPENDKVFPFFFCRLTDNRTIIRFTDNNRYAESTYYEGGIFIDILPIDSFPNTKEEILRHEKSLYPFFKLYRLKKRKGFFIKETSFIRNGLTAILKAVLCIVSERWLREKINKKLIYYNNKATDYRGYWTNYWHHPWVFPAHVFSDLMELEFEDASFCVISGYDEYLRCEYGDYMKLPPVEKQIGEHFFNAYWK